MSNNNTIVNINNPSSSPTPRRSAKNVLDIIEGGATETVFKIAEPQPQLLYLFSENISSDGLHQVNGSGSPNDIISPQRHNEDRFVKKIRVQSVPQLQQKHGNQSLSSSDDDGEIQDNKSDKTLKQNSPNIEDFQNHIMANQAKMEAISEVLTSQGNQNQSHDFHEINNNNYPDNQINLFEERKQSSQALKFSPVQNPKILVMHPSPSIEFSQQIQHEQSPDKQNDNTSDIALESNFPRRTNYKSNQSKISMDKSQSIVQNQKINSLIFQSPVQEPNLTSNNLNGRLYETNNILSQNQQQSILNISKPLHQRNMSHQVTDIKNQQHVNDTYQDEDSLVMSERGDGENHSKIQSQKSKNFTSSQKKVPKPMIYMVKNQQQTKQLSIIKQQHQNTITDEGGLETEMAANNHQTFEKSEDLDDNNMIFQDNDLIYVKGRARNDNYIDIAASSVCWDPNQIMVEGGDRYTIGSKSIPFSVTHKHETEFQNNFCDDGETFKFSMLQQTPKQFPSSSNKNKDLMNNNSLHKSSMFLETLQNQQAQENNDHMDDFNTKDFPTIDNEEGAGLGGNFRTSGKSNNENVSKFYNTQYSMIQTVTTKRLQLAILEAKCNGRKVRADLEYFQLRQDKSISSYQFPDGLVIIDEEGPLIIQDSDMSLLNGVGGSKVLLGNQNTLIIKNLQTETLRISALQFELQSPSLKNEYDTPQTQTASGQENQLFHIIQDEESQHPSAQLIMKTKTIIFEDCAFLQDAANYEFSEANQGTLSNKSCMNCAFLGFHHGLVCNSPNVQISIFNCMFKKQHFESIIGIDLQYLKLSQTIFKKSCVLDSYRSSLSLIYNQNITPQSEDCVVEIIGCTFRKCYGLGLQIAGLEKQNQKLQIKIKDSKFQLCQGQSSLKFENLKGVQLNRFEYRESNLTQKSHNSQSPSRKQLKQDQMIKLTDCQFTDSKKNGIELNNVFSGFLIKRCLFKDNKDSGIYINQQIQDSDTVVCGCTCRPNANQSSFLQVSQFNDKQAVEDSPGNQQQQTNSNRMGKEQQQAIIVNKIEECQIQMNQMHGIEIIGYKENDLIISDCTILDNFCDGINLSAEDLGDQDQLSRQQTNQSNDGDPLTKNLLSPKNTTVPKNQSSTQRPLKSQRTGQMAQLQTPKIQLNTNKISSNKNIGLHLASELPKKTWYYLYGNEFSNNLNTDVYINDEQPYKKTKFLKYRKVQTNKLEQQIQIGFEQNDSYIQKVTDDSKILDQNLEMTLIEEQFSSFSALNGIGKSTGQKSLKSYGNLNGNNNRGIGIQSQSDNYTDENQPIKQAKKRKMSVSSCIGRLCQPCGNIKSKRYQQQNQQNATQTSRGGLSKQDTTAHSKDIGNNMNQSQKLLLTNRQQNYQNDFELQQNLQQQQLSQNNLSINLSQQLGVADRFKELYQNEQSNFSLDKQQFDLYGLNKGEGDSIDFNIKSDQDIGGRGNAQPRGSSFNKHQMLGNQSSHSIQSQQSSNRRLTTLQNYPKHPIKSTQQDFDQIVRFNSENIITGSLNNMNKNKHSDKAKLVENKSKIENSDKKANKSSEKYKVQENDSQSKVQTQNNNNNNCYIF
eukprot:403343373